MKSLKIVGVMCALGLLILVGGYYWGNEYLKKGSNQLNWLVDTGMPLRELLIISEGKNQQIDGFSKSLLQKLSKEDAAKYKNLVCSEMSKYCVNIALISVNHFSHFRGSNIEKASEMALSHAQSFYEQTPSECALDFEASKLNYELAKIKRGKKDLAEKQSREIISKIKSDGGFVFNTFDKNCVSNLVIYGDRYNLYLLIVAELMSLAGDGYIKGSNVLLSYDSISHYGLEK